MTGDLFGGLAGRTDDPETLAALEVDYTPTAVVVQFLLALKMVVEEQRTWPAQPGTWEPRCVLDPSAGSGSFGRAMRAIWPEAHLTGVEERASEADNLAAAYDDALVGDGIEAVRSCEGFDLIASNPPFSAFGSKDARGRVRFWPAEFWKNGLVNAGGIVAFVGLSQWGKAPKPVPIWTTGVHSCSCALAGASSTAARERRGSPRSPRSVGCRAAQHMSCATTGVIPVSTACGLGRASTVWECGARPGALSSCACSQ
ncbi:hypothetical protein [Nannocystis pusilla]|uniref:hypothetical protein n=1 Tax=Nannocystis pusilla TaxID=889268 RepID=UPI003B76601A